MSSTRKVFRVFLASPNDLQDEREAVRNAVVEFNESWADELGYQIELSGWEETVPAFGRPQDLINPKLDLCDLFIGLIWRRWGTPPSLDENFSSGFYEEYKRAIAQRESSEKPEISIFFKRVPEEYMEDPGDDLKKVLKFQETIINEKKILFRKFSTIDEIGKLTRQCLNKYVLQVRDADAPYESFDSKAEPITFSLEMQKSEKTSPKSSPLSVEGLTFLESLVDKFGRESAMDDISGYEIARFRLLANSISKPGNQEMNLGVHDINTLFLEHSRGLQLGEIEIMCLARLGFQHLGSETVPLWRWYSALSNSRLQVALSASTIGVNDNEKIAAISVLNALALEIPTNDGSIERDWILISWFHEDSSANVKCTALNYLAKNGTADDYSIVKKEYDRGNYWTIDSALECMVGILLRTERRALARKLILESQFESLPADILQAVLDGFDNMETSDLLPGLKHRNAHVRLRTLRIMLERDSLDSTMAEQLSEDTDPLIRYEAITALLKFGKSFTEEEIKKNLVRPQSQHGTLLGQITIDGSDRSGEELFSQYQLESLRNHTETELTKMVEASMIYDDVAFFARAERFFANYARELRRNVDDMFGEYVKERIRGIEITLGALIAGIDMVKSAKNAEDFYRKKLTRQGLNILCRACKREDLRRIRGNLQNCYAGASKADTEYLGKHGEWADISLLANTELLNFAGDLPFLMVREDFQEKVATAVATAILGMGRRHSVSKLLSLDIPAIILKKTIELCTVSRFSKVSQDTLFELLHHESADVRRAASIKSVQAFSVKRIKSILHDYTSRDKYRYYNVIHWLDLGASMSRAEARKVAYAATN